MTTFKLTGRIGNDAKKTTFESGKSVVEFSIAENYTYRSNGEKITETEWHDCKIWRNADHSGIVDYLKNPDCYRDDIRFR